MSRPQRLIELLGVLQARHRATAGELAEQLGVTPRTVLRDVRALQDADIPVVAERGAFGGITLLPGQQPDLSRLTRTEADLLRAVGLDLDRSRALGAEVAARSALGKLAGRQQPAPVPGGLPLSLAEVVTVENRPWFAEPEQGVDVAGLARDVRAGNRLRIRYRSSGTQAAGERVVDPYGLLQRAGRWYLVALDGPRPRLFALTRLEEWEVLDAPRRLPPGTELAGVARTLGEALEGRNPVVVTARLDADRIDLARRILGSRLRSASEPETGSVIIQVAYAELDGVRQLLQFGDHLEVLAPESARRLIYRLAKHLARAHESDAATQTQAPRRRPGVPTAACPPTRG